MESSWGLPPPTFTVETTSQFGSRVNTTRTDAGVGGVAQMRRAAPVFSAGSGAVETPLLGIGDQGWQVGMLHFVHTHTGHPYG